MAVTSILLSLSLKPSLEIPEGTQTLQSGVELKIEQSGWHSAGPGFSQLLQMALCNTLRVVQPAVIQSNYPNSMRAIFSTRKATYAYLMTLSHT